MRKILFLGAVLAALVAFGAALLELLGAGEFSSLVALSISLAVLLFMVATTDALRDLLRHSRTIRAGVKTVTRQTLGGARLGTQRPAAPEVGHQGKSLARGPFHEGLSTLRVAFTNDAAQQWFGGSVSLVDLSSKGPLGVNAGQWADVLVVGGGPAKEQFGDISEAIRGAKERGTLVVGLLGAGGDEAVAAMADVTVRPSIIDDVGADVVLAPVVDIGDISPIGTSPMLSTGPLIAVETAGTGDDRRRLKFFEHLLAGQGLDGFVRNDLQFMQRGRAGVITERLDELRASSGVIDHESLHESVADRAQHLAELACAGIPFVLLDEDLSELVDSLGHELLGLVSRPVQDLLDPVKREWLSVQQRGASLRRFSPAMRWDEILKAGGSLIEVLPVVTVLLATMRPEEIDHFLEEVERQTYPRVELVAVLHGEAFSGEDEARIKDTGATVVRVSSEVAFGEALNLGTAKATGDLLTKMDDDDWYSEDHLWDLAIAMEFSGADLVGKAAEWVYVEELDMTTRRAYAFSETMGHPAMAGGAIMMRTATVKRVGGFRRAVRHIDWGIIQDIVAAGGTTYRTHGMGYVLHRKTEGHTWAANSDYFLDVAESQLRGLALNEALVSQNRKGSTE